MTPQPPFAALRAFAAIGRHGGIRRAAEALGISHAIVSRHLSGLEDMLGVMLLNRHTGELTPTGQSYHARIGAALAEIEMATMAVMAQRRPGLTIWCSAGFALHWLTRRLPAFSRGRGRPVVDLRSTDAEPSFERDEADGDIRYSYDHAPQPLAHGVRAEELARPQVFPVAAPELLARWPRPVMTLADLLAMPLIEEGSPAEWAAWLSAQEHGGAALPPAVARYGQAHLTLAAARAGQGVALSNHFLAAEDLAGGRLVPVVPQRQALQPVTLGAYVFRCPRARWSDPLLARFRAWLAEAVSADAGAP
ncbi:MAG TPA: LysR substrate-binding domain-containing protein [Novosphingobium sp.]|nr:LysR substrate-binding domain-containing protein [Novosphingobium sp.]